MSEECTHDCGSCGQDCGDRTQPQSLLAEANPESHVNRSKAQRKVIRQNGTIQASRTASKSNGILRPAELQNCNKKQD